MTIFFTDIYFDFNNILNKDIILNDRIKYFYQNVSVCDEVCEYKEINLENMTVTLNCIFNDISNNELNQESNFLYDTLEVIFDLININNFLLLKCYKNALKYFTSSVGSWITLILGIVQTNCYGFTLFLYGFAKN